MDARDRSIQAIILNSRDYKEQDRLLTLITPLGGPEKAIARGARKPGGSLRSVAQAFSRVELVLSPAKGGISFVKEGLPQESYLVLGEDLRPFAYASYMAELLLMVWPERKPAPELYALAQTVLTLLKYDDQPERTLRFFELRLLRSAGWLPVLDECAQCGQRIMGRRFALSPRRGALLCEACAAQLDSTAPLLSPGSVQAARRLNELSLSKLPALRLSPTQNQELERALGHYLTYHLDAVGKSRQVLASLLRQ